MNIFKSPMFYIVGLVILMIAVGYHLKRQTAAEQENNLLKKVKQEFPNHPFNLYGVSNVGQDRYYVVGSNGVILRSEDKGRTWSECSLDQPGKNLTSVCFTDEYMGWAVGTSGMAYETVDGGQEWTPIKLRIGDA